jgi:hypothetical protein
MSWITEILVQCMIFTVHKVTAVTSYTHLSKLCVTNHFNKQLPLTWITCKLQQDGTSWLCLEAVIKTCMKLNQCECTVENSWWWAEKMPETYRVLWQNKIGIISACGWLLKKKSITMQHGNMNVKQCFHGIKCLHLPYRECVGSRFHLYIGKQTVLCHTVSKICDYKLEGVHSLLEDWSCRYPSK